MVNGRLVEQKKRTKTEEAKGNYVQIQMIAAMAAGKYWGDLGVVKGFGI